MDIKTIFLILTLSLYVITLALIAWKTFRGVRRGIVRQSFYLGAVILCALASLLITVISRNVLFNSIAESGTQGILDFIASLGISFEGKMQDILLAVDGVAISYVLAIPIALISPFIFFVLYIVIKPILNLILRIAFKIFKKRDAKKKKAEEAVAEEAVAEEKTESKETTEAHETLETEDKAETPETAETAEVGAEEIKEEPAKRKKFNYVPLVSGALGAVEGLLIMVVLTIPLCSILSLGTTVTSKLEFDEPTVNEILDEVNGYANTPAYKVMDFAGGSLIRNALSTVKIEKTRFNVSKEIGNMADFAIDITSFLDGSEASLEAMLTPEKEALLDSMIATIEESPCITTIISSGMHVVSGIFFADLPENSNDPKDKLLSSLAELLNTSDPTTVASDLRTMKELLFFFNENGVIDLLSSSDSDAITNVLSKKDAEGNTVIKAAISMLKSNPRTAKIIAVLNELSISVMCQSMGIEGDAAAVYENLKTGLTDLIAITPDNYATEEEYKASVKESLNATLTNNDIVLEEEIVDTMTDYVSEYLEESRENGTLSTEMSDEDVTEIILTYYDAYLEYQESGEIPEDIPGLPEGLPEGTPESSPEGLLPIQ